MKRVLKTTASSLLIFALAFIVFATSFHVGALKTFFYPHLRELQYQWILFKTRDYQAIETENFVIRYDQEDQEVIDLVAEASEKHYEEMVDMFNYRPERKTVVILYNDPAALMTNSNLGKGKPPMGVYYASTVQLLSPRLWVNEHEDMREVFLNEGPMVHEFTHLLVDDMAKGNYPLWFTEGMALYQEYVQTGYEWGKDLRYPEDRPYTLQQLTEEFGNLDEMLAYKRSFEIVRDIIENHGFEGMKQVLESLGSGKTLSAAKREAFKEDVLKIYFE
ncbi:peptidase MA family metallohydrolase [Geosporobacter ferrireducens]|uniref:Peptidase MA-like domain-containing protein n=1 Tax=Geosporobacter ferrireducens TaxID=1424294 RepID=A0A1D8GHZ2_9FIRM|nr:hypothetical protein [Geosporobacter ferrireducens]AOT70543.1 hypothetical protein Gferi_13760 [Geosporobacter ferrireducens]MTI57097.1 hypothetical protein [Geosporobacter ferrireducens]